MDDVTAAKYIIDWYNGEFSELATSVITFLTRILTIQMSTGETCMPSCSMASSMPRSK